jgi:energy-converting hydrogenase Eha subunit A
MAAAVVDGKLYVIGGQPSAFTPEVLATVEAYDPKTDSWARKPDIPTPRVFAAAAGADGILYVIGGNPSGGFLNPTPVVEAYDPKTNTWNTVANLPTPRANLAAVTVDGKVFAVGGVSLEGPLGVVVEAYDPETNTWTTRASMPTPRFNLAVAGIDGVLYAAGGHGELSNGLPAIAVVDAYDPNSNAWSSKAAMPTPRGGLGLVSVENTLYAVGGLGLAEDFSTVLLGVNEALVVFLPVVIDIKPGDSSNVINLRSGGVVAVAILSSEEFDATTVDPATVTFAGAAVAQRGFGKPMVSVAHADSDGRLDLLLHFRIRELELEPADTEAVLRGTTFSGQRIRGQDSVRLVPALGANSKPERRQTPRHR